MGYSLKTSTMIKITDKQEPISLNQESKDRVNLKLGYFLMKSDLPGKVRQGRGLVRRILNRRFIRGVKRLNAPLDSEGARLLQERRNKFIKQIQEKNNDTKTTTPMP